MNTVNMLHYTFVKDIWLYVTSTLFFLRRCQVSEIKADWHTGSNSWLWNCVSEVKEITRGCFLLTPQLLDEIYEDLIVHQLEAAEILGLCFECSFVLWASRLPTQVARTHTRLRELKSTTEKPWDTHTHTNHRSTPKSTRDPDLLYPLQEQSSAGKRKKVGFEKKSGWEKEIKTGKKKWHQAQCDCVGMNKRGKRGKLCIWNYWSK